jgi:hypothetical protein
LLAQAVADGALAITPTQRLAAATLHRTEMISALQAERTLAEEAVRLDEAGIAYRAIDGPPLAHLAYPTLDWRPFDRIALLVGREQRSQAVDMFCAANWQAELAGSHPSGESPIVLRHRGGIQLDLHDRLVDPRTGSSPPEHLYFARSLSFTLGRTKVSTLSPEALFMRACQVVAVAKPRASLQAHRDVGQLLSWPLVDIDAALQLISACRMAELVAGVLSATREILALDDPESQQADGRSTGLR